MRGKLEGIDRKILTAGITPADAGKTIMYPSRVTLSRDHPRGCGENPRRQADRVELPGSPPRMRGKPPDYLTDAQRERITPADAGKTSNGVLRENSLRDHPRGCGENAIASFFIRFQSGSPPRMRGKQKQGDCKWQSQRITPADAGKTLKRSFRNQPFCS